MLSCPPSDGPYSVTVEGYRQNDQIKDPHVAVEIERAFDL